MEQPQSKYSNQRVPGKEHIPLYPKGFVAIRIIQLIFSIIILGLSAFGIVFLVFAGDALTLFTSIATIITSIYCLVAHFGPAKAYNYWAILGLDIFLVIFWLISFAILAAQIASAFAYYYSYSDYYDDYYDLSDYDTAVNTYGGCLAAAAGLGGVEFLLYIISLSIHGVMLHRHRKAGLKAMPINGAPGGTGAGVELTAGGEKFQMQPQPAQVYQEPNPMAGHPPPPQGYYPPQSPSPLSSQPTGSTYVQPQQMGNPGQPVYEVPGQAQQYHAAQ
ncbi:hypothetical protein F5Y00DRAFT_224876 [Daldinia vernicosa]|uniref:uncharacterized protein n=1 Tax=Daldinia vernicosa TaxID=114800 RepID=UPI00200829D1|nr:uncharacterized protein F5Y00DRAFT_224876 [Daldinia vernicosa]KAI0853523.1 hypothetical protein F5Y00DRAFT_224876 [Daldinia vernicosa]